MMDALKLTVTFALSGCLLAEPGSGQFVTAHSGKWTVGKREGMFEPVFFGRPVAKDEILRAEGPGALRMKCLDHTVLHASTSGVRDFEPCGGQREILSGIGAAFLEKAQAIFLRDPPRLLSAISKSVDGMDLADAVADAATPATFKVVFSNLPPGKYTLRIRSVRNPDEGERKAAIAWSGPEGDAPALPLSKGLFQVVAFGSDGDPVGSDAWVLVVESSRYRALMGELDQVRSEAAKLESGISPGAARRLTRAYLLSLDGARNP